MRPLLEAQDLHIRFGGVVAAAGISLEVFPGEFLAIIGPNGAGKTTFLNLCTGYLRPDRGRVFFKDREITHLSPRAITRLGIARAFQIPQLFAEGSVLDNMLLALAARQGFWTRAPLQNPKREVQAQGILALLNLAEHAQLKIEEIPEGVRKLLDVALALALEPELLFLDEPTSGVSSEEKHRVMGTLVGALRGQRVTVVFVEHDMEVVARYADRVAVWAEGQIIAQGPPEAVLSDPVVLEKVVGVE